jgi:hypothetical protein
MLTVDNNFIKDRHTTTDQTRIATLWNHSQTKQQVGVNDMEKQKGNGEKENKNYLFSLQ